MKQKCIIIFFQETQLTTVNKGNSSMPLFDSQTSIENKTNPDYKLKLRSKHQRNPEITSFAQKLKPILYKTVYFNYARIKRN